MVYAMNRNIGLLFSMLGALSFNGVGTLPTWANSADVDTKLSQQQPIETLLDATVHQVEQGDFDQASASLERALRIEPQNALVWHLLGQIRMHQARYPEAIAMANKSNNFASGNKSLQEQNAHLIEVAERLSAGERKMVTNKTSIKPAQETEKQTLLINIRKALPPVKPSWDSPASSLTDRSETETLTSLPRTRPSAQEVIDRLQRQSRQPMPGKKLRTSFDTGFDASSRQGKNALLTNDLGTYRGRLYPVRTRRKSWP